MFTFQAALHYVGDLDSADGYASPPFGEDQDIEDSSPPSNGVRQIIPTPPPESKHDSPAPDSTHSSHGSCVSPQFSASATSNSYIKGSSLEESPVSSPGSSYAGELDTNGQDNFIASNVVAEMPKLIKRETCIRSTSDDAASAIPGGATNTSRDVPKNIKLPQSKFSVQYSCAIMRDSKGCSAEYHSLRIPFALLFLLSMLPTFICP